MSKYFSFCTKSKSNSTKKQTRSVHKKHASYSVCLRASLLVIIFLLLGAYVYLSNFSVSKGFEISAIEQEIGQLSRQNEVLTQDAANLKTLTNVEQRLENMDMVAVTDIQYIHVSGNGLGFAR